MSRTDPLLAHRLHAENRLRRGEAAAFRGVVAAMTIWLDTARALVLHKPLPAAAVDLLAPPSVTAAAGNSPPDIEAAQAATEVWARAVARHVDPALSEAFGEAFLDAERRADISPLPFQLAYLEQVHDRLRIWPEGAFEELRPELLEMLSEGMDYEQIEERIGRILDIDAPSRRLRAEISAVDRQIDDPTTTPSDRRALRARRRALWEQHDASLGQWQWLARRIARTEIHGAIEGGTLAAAQAVEQAGGQARFKRWLATTDERTRGTHVVADGQMVKLAEPFRVGLAELQHPGEAGGPAHEVINCRCTMLILTETEVQDALQGMWGGRGVAPGAARMGPDDPDDAAAALARWEAEQRGEVLEDETPPEPPDPLPDSDPETDDDPEPEPEPDEEPTEDENTDDELDDEDEPDDDEPDDDEDGIDGEDQDDDEDLVDEDDSATDEDPDAADDEDDLDDEPEAEAEPVISASTRDLLDRVRESLPDDRDGWNALTQAELIRPEETYGERRIWQVEQETAQLRARLEQLRADRRFAAFRDSDEDDLWIEGQRRRRQAEELEGKLSRARSERSIERLTRQLEAARADREALDEYMRLPIQIANNETLLQDWRDNPPDPDIWNQMMVARWESAYATDDRGNLLPPPELEAHLDSVLGAGAALWEDIARALELDEGVQRARRDLADLDPSIYNGRRDARREVARAEAAVIRAALAEVREFSGHEQRVTTAVPSDSHRRRGNNPIRSGNAAVLDDLRDAERIFPREWLEAADARGELVLGRVDRAYFSAKGGGDGRDLLAANNPVLPQYDGAFNSYEREVMMHELGHRMEQAIPGLTHLEYAFVRRRAMVSGRLEERTEIYRGSGEFALADKWKDPYAGKTYAHDSRNPAQVAHEVFQVGLQDVFGRSRFKFDDSSELTWFILASMLLL
ncbi:phage minor head protein [Nocardia sp. NPDC004260]